MTDSDGPQRPSRGARTLVVLGSVCDSLGTLQDCSAEIAGKVDEQSTEVRRNTEEQRQQWAEIGKLRSELVRLGDRLGSLEQLERQRHADVMAAIAGLGARVKTQAELMAEQDPVRRHPAAEP